MAVVVAQLVERSLRTPRSMVQIPTSAMPVVVAQLVERSLPTPEINGSNPNIGYGSGGGSIGRAVTSDTRDQWFKSQHRQNFIY